MISYHPTHAVLMAFTQGDLETSISLIVASHIEMCEHCQTEIINLTQNAADKVFEQDIMNDLVGTNNPEFDNELSASMIDNIMSLPDDDVDFKAYSEIDITQQTAKLMHHKDGDLRLPRALNTLNSAPWQGVGKIYRSRFQLNDDERRLSLLKIDKGGQIPQHTHTGIEITLLLEGFFEDDMGTYKPGDFIWLDAAQTHSPITQEGCICLTLVSDALHFTQGFSKILNPLGKLIY